MRVLNQWKLLAALSAALLPASLVSAQNATDTKAAETTTPPAATSNADVKSTTPSATADSNVQTPSAPSTSANATVQSQAPSTTSTAPAPSASANTTVQTQAPPTSTSPALNPPSVSAGANSTQLNGNVNNSTQLNANVNAQTNLNTNLNTNTQISQQNLIAGLQFGQPTAQGLAIATLNPSNVFYTSGLRQGDVIVSYNGQPIRSQADFTRYVTYVPGQRVPVIVWRNGQQQTLYVTYQAAGVPMNHPIPPTTGAGAFLGVSFEPNPNAAVVRAVTPGSPAEHAGLKPGDMIVALNGNQIHSSQQVTQIVSSMQPGERLDIELARRVNDRAQAVLAARPGQVPLTAGVPAAPNTNVVVPERRTAEPVPGGRLGDTDGDGRVLDRDGAINRRGRLIPPRN